MKIRRSSIWGIGAILLAGAVVGLTAAARRGNVASPDDAAPVVRVKRGNLSLTIHTTGELRANRSIMLTAPAIGGGALRITHLAHSGVAVKRGEIVIEFDPIEQRYQLEQSRSELLQAEQDITKAKADAAVQTSEDKVALLKARFAVRRGELEVQKNELVSAIDAEKNQLALEQAKRALEQLEQDIKSHATSGRAGIDLAHEKWNKAKLAMDQAQQNIEKMRLVAPIDGLVSIERNTDSTGVVLFAASRPDYHEGDRVQPGSAIAQVIDSGNMELTAKVNERQRSNITVGQSAEIEFDALPGKVFRGTVKSAGGMAQEGDFFFETNVAGSFDITVQLADWDSRLCPGLTAEIVITGDRKNALYIPRQAIFQKDSKQIVYVMDGRSFVPAEVHVARENESYAEIEAATGTLNEGDEVALIDPTLSRTAGYSASASGAGELQ